MNLSDKKAISISVCIYDIEGSNKQLGAEYRQKIQNKILDIENKLTSLDIDRNKLASLQDDLFELYNYTENIDIKAFTCGTDNTADDTAEVLKWPTALVWPLVPATSSKGNNGNPARKDGGCTCHC
ncbi:MAG: hypothetical protein M3247_07150 [Thermoproteota archaeon]|nr:hypothetical protein [Thermoproteota archaeon]